MKWVQDKAFQKGRGDSSETSDNLSGISIPCHFLSRSHTVTGLSFLQKKNWMKRFYLIIKMHNRYFCSCNERCLSKKCTHSLTIIKLSLAWPQHKEEWVFIITTKCIHVHSLSVFTRF